MFELMTASQRMSATPAPAQAGLEPGEEVKQEEGADNVSLRLHHALQLLDTSSR